MPRRSQRPLADRRRRASRMRNSEPEAIASSKCQVRSLSLDRQVAERLGVDAAHRLQAGELGGEEASSASSSSPKRSSIAIAATALRPMSDSA